MDIISWTNSKFTEEFGDHWSFSNILLLLIYILYIHSLNTNHDECHATLFQNYYTYNCSTIYHIFTYDVRTLLFLEKGIIYEFTLLDMLLAITMLYSASYFSNYSKTKTVIWLNKLSSIDKYIEKLYLTTKQHYDESPRSDMVYLNQLYSDSKIKCKNRDSLYNLFIKFSFLIVLSFVKFTPTDIVIFISFYLLSLVISYTNYIYFIKIHLPILINYRMASGALLNNSDPFSSI